MKTKQSCFILLINVVFFLHVFTGCNVSFDMSEPSISSEWAEPSDGPGYDDLVETDKLVLYIRQSNERVERRMINLFQQAYDVDVEIQNLGKGQGDYYWFQKTRQEAEKTHEFHY